MSDKNWNQLNELDRKIRTHFPTGMGTGNRKVVIEFINGFELFNTRPYHNLETFSDGYRLTDTETGVEYSAEDLDDAISGFIKVVNKYRAEHGMTVTQERPLSKAVEDVSL